MNKFDLSIIVPVYNTEEYIIECLNSIYEQKLKNFEIIIINDGSTDNSINEINKYSSKKKNIKVYSQINKGQGSARNKALKMAEGKYIYFMDSDDLLVPSHFGEFFMYINEKNYDAGFFDASTFLDDNYEGEIIPTDYNYTRSKSYNYYSNGIDMFIDMHENDEWYVSPCLYIIKREIIILNNLKFPEGIKYEDEVFSYILPFFLKESFHLKEKLFNRRIRSGSTVTSLSKVNSYKSLVEVLVHLSNFYQSFEINNSKAKSIMYKKIRNMYIYIQKFKRKNNINDLEAEAKMNKIYIANNGFDFQTKLALNYSGIYNLMLKIYKLLRRV